MTETTDRSRKARGQVPNCNVFYYARSMSGMFQLDGQVAVVTGAGRGIGAATAVALAEAGADVLISARTSRDLEGVASQIEEKGRRAVIVPADLSDLDAVAGLAE